MGREAIETAIADRVYQAERVAAAMLGYDRGDGAMLALGAFCGVLEIARADDRPAVWPRGSEPR